MTAVLYGIEWSSQGIGEVYGPLDDQAELRAESETSTPETETPLMTDGYDERMQTARREAARR